MSQIVGPAKDIPAPDVYTNAQVMAWMYDEYSRIREYDSPSFISGKPIVLGGSRGRRRPRLSGWSSQPGKRRRLGIELAGARVIVQGFGNVGSHVAEILHAEGAKVVGISDAGGALYKPDGLDIPHLLDRRDSFGMVTNLFQNERIPNEELLTKECDILIPAAIENQIREDNADQIQARIVVEAANGPTTLGATRILDRRGILVIPDILANAGGVTVSYFEWVQNNQGFYWTEEEVNQRLAQMMVAAVHKVLAMAKSHQVDTRLAAYMVGIRRLAEAVQLRGWV